MRSEFTERVYAAARQIPPGRVASYGCLAALAGNPRAARIVGYVMHTCPAQAHVPCHRVVREDGALSGYRWGTARKAQLPAREAQHEEE